MTTSTGNTKVDNALDELFGTIESILFPKAEAPEEGDGAAEDVDTKPEATESIDTDFLLAEAVRILKKAEDNASYPNGSAALVAVADRYIALLELLSVYGEEA